MLVVAAVEDWYQLVAPEKWNLSYHPVIRVENISFINYIRTTGILSILYCLLLDTKNSEISTNKSEVLSDYTYLN